MRAFIGPAHLPLLRTAQAHDFIDRRFRDTAADWHAAPVAPAVVDQVLAIGLLVPIRLTKVSPQRHVRRVFRYESEHVMDALESFDGFGTLAVPCQPFRRRDFVFYRRPVWHQEIRKLLCRLLDRAKFHGNVRPIYNPVQRPFGSIDGFLKSACAVKDDRNFLIAHDALLREKMIKSGRGRRDLSIDVSINFATTVLTNRTAGDDDHMSPVDGGLLEE